MKKVIFIEVVFLIILIIIPNIPYKIPQKIKDNNYIELEVSKSCCGLDVTSGNEAIDEYANSLGYTNINRNEIYLSGKDPYKEFAIKDGYYYYRKFRLYGELTRDRDESDILTIDIKEWYPRGTYVRLHHTYPWKEYKDMYWNVVRCYIVISLIIYVLILIKLYKEWE